MDTFIELIKILGPAAIVLYAVYLMMRSFLNARTEELKLMTRQKNQETVIPIRLQAYERMALLLERITPSNIIPRLNKNEMPATVLHQILVTEIRQEFNHNLSQQIYMSDEAWAYIRAAVEDTITIINDVSIGLPEESTGLDLAKLVLERSVQKDSITSAIAYIKNEIKEVF